MYTQCILWKTGAVTFKGRRKLFVYCPFYQIDRLNYFVTIANYSRSGESKNNLAHCKTECYMSQSTDGGRDHFVLSLESLVS